MPTVPVYEQQVKPREGTVPVPPQAPVVEAAFGGQVARAKQGFGEQVQKSVKVLGDKLLEAQIRKDDLEVMERSTQFQAELQTRLNDPTPDPATGLPRGYLNRQLGQANNITPDYDDSVGELQKKYMESVSGITQKEKLVNLLASHSLSGRDQVQRHEADQRVKNYAITVKAATESAVNTAGRTPNVETLNQLIETSQQALSRSLVNVGHDPNSQPVKNATEALTGQMVSSAFSSVLEVDSDRAKAILDANRDRIPSDVRDDLQKKLDGKALFTQQAKIYDSLSTAKTPEGYTDTTKMTAAIRAMPDLTPERKEQIVRYAESRAAEDKQNLNQERAGVDRNFSNEVIQAKANGSKLDDAIKMAPKYSYDLTDGHAKELYVRKLYAGPGDTDPTSYIALWEGIRNKIVNRRDIDNAFLNGYIKASDWEQLRKDHYQMQTTGQSVEDKAVNERVKVWANENIHNKKERDNFLYVYEEATRAMPPAQKFTYSQDLMKKHEDNKWYTWNKPEYKVQLQGIDADRTEAGNLYNIMGEDEVNAIARGVLTESGRPKWTVQDINAFAREFGGPAKIVPGTPVHNAIRSLNRRGKLVTAETIKRALQHVPDGNF